MSIFKRPWHQDLPAEIDPGIQILPRPVHPWQPEDARFHIRHPVNPWLLNPVNPDPGFHIRPPPVHPWQPNTSFHVRPLPAEPWKRPGHSQR